MKPPALLTVIRAHINRLRLGTVRSPRSSDYLTPARECIPTPALVFYRNRRPGDLSGKRWQIIPPDLTVEICCSWEFYDASRNALRLIRCGTKAAVIAVRNAREIYVFRRNQAPLILRENDTLSVPRLLPRFAVSVRSVLPFDDTKPENQPSKTLFDPGFYQRDRMVLRGGRMPYTHEIGYWHRREDPRLYDRETGIFADLAQPEHQWVEGGLRLSGQLVIQRAGRQAEDLAVRSSKPVEFDGWCEPDGLQFLKCWAKGILLVEKGTDYHFLSRAWRDLNLLIACGHGIPQPNARRVLHRLSTQFKIPVYVLADNDTWGYYLFSVLKRGSIAPQVNIPQLAVQDVRFLGLRARELPPEITRRCRLPWQKRWDLRLKAMARYPCFLSKEWSAEFEAFRRQGGSIEMCVGPLAFDDRGGRVAYRSTSYRRFVRKYLIPKLKTRDWLS